MVSNENITVETNKVIRKSQRRLYSGKTKKQKRREYSARKENKTLLINNNVTNLSDVSLTVNEIKVLNKGLTFVPHDVRIKFQDLDKDIKRFERKLQITHFFTQKNKQKRSSLTGRIVKPSDSNEDNNKHKTLPLTSSNQNWWPKRLNAHITDFSYNLKREIVKMHRQKTQMINITKREQAALKNLSNNDKIVIKKADKNSGIVVMNKEDYHQKVSKMLADTNVYTKLENYDVEAVKKQSDAICISLMDKELIKFKQFKHLTEYTAKTPIFYGMPKIHKKDCPLRPIVSQINGPTYRLNTYIHELLQVAEKEIPFLFKDTTAFLNVIEANKNVPENTFLVTMDVVSLYTNIPHDEAVELVTEYYVETLREWNKYDCCINPVEPEMLKTLLDFMLKQCTFEFDGNAYKQNYGCPMGAPASVRIANVYMYKLLNRFLQNYTGCIPSFLGRLIDDIFFLWYYDEESLLTLYNTLNAFHSTIKFEINYSKEAVNFLDTTTYISNNTVHTKLYIKPTDKKQYLHYTSCHPKHVKNAIPYSQAIRYRRIIDDDALLQTELKNLKEKFVSRGYPGKIVEHSINKSLLLDRSDLLKYKIKTTNVSNNENTQDRQKSDLFLPLIIPFSFKYCDMYTKTLYDVLYELWSQLLLKDHKLADTFSNSKPVIVYKRGPTLANNLITAKFTSTYNYATNHTSVVALDDDVDLDNINTLIQLQMYTDDYEDDDGCRRGGVKKCLIKRCKCCQNIITGNEFTHPTSKQSFSISDSMNCSTKNICYIIMCKKCHILYVGETSRQLKDRLNDHRSAIKRKSKTAISIHFNDVFHNADHLTIMPIEFVNGSQCYRQNREQFWIKELNTVYPFGLNNYPLIARRR